MDVIKWQELYIDAYYSQWSARQAYILIIKYDQYFILTVSI